jgi:hypothetical protein
MCNVIFPKCTSYKISKYFNNSKSSSRRTNFLLPNIPSSRCRAYTSDPLFRNHHCKIRSFFSYITTLIQIHAIHIDEWDGETWPRTDSKWQYGSWLSVLPHTHTPKQTEENHEKLRTASRSAQGPGARHMSTVSSQSHNSLSSLLSRSSN